MPAARILLVDDDESILQLVSDTLTRDGFLLSTAGSPAEALQRVRRLGDDFHLVVSDVNLPGMNGFQFRAEFYRTLGHQNTPFLFMSAADVAVETDIARSLGRDPILLKPFARADLRRQVFSALKFVRVSTGPLPGQLDRVLADVADTHGTGIMTAMRGTAMKRVVFQHGKVAFAASNDPRELIGQAFIRAGLISEKDLLAAFEETRKSPAEPGKPALGAALAALRKVTPEQSRAVFENKVREAVLDVYLWKEGVVEYSEGNVSDADLLFPIQVDVEALRREGLLRRRSWAEVEAQLPDRTTRFYRVPEVPLPTGFPKTNGERALLRYVDEGRTMADMLLEMRGQDFAVGMRLARMVRTGVLRTGRSSGFSGATYRADEPGLDIQDQFESLFADMIEDEPEIATTPDPIPPPPLTQPDFPESALAFAEALRRLRAGDPRGAHGLLVRSLSLEPMNSLARLRLEEVEKTIAQEARKAGFHDARTLSLAVDVQTLVGKEIAAHDAFVLSRLAAGEHTVGELLKLCPFPEHELLEILRRHLGTGTLQG